MTLDEIPRYHIDDDACPESYIRVIAVRHLDELSTVLPLLYRQERWMLIDLDRYYCLAIGKSIALDCHASDLLDR